MTSPPSYNLVEEPCVPVIGPNGREQVGLRELLLRAHELISIAPERPLASVALIRLLLTVVERAFPIEVDEDIEDLWHEGQFDEEAINAFFDEHADRFDLFHPEHPFGQATSLTPVGKGGYKSPTVLLLHVASGNNVPLFSSFTESTEVALSPDEAFLALLEVLNFDAKGIRTGVQGDPEVSKGKSYGNPLGLLGMLGIVLPIGRNVFETLLLSMSPQPGIQEEDFPVWLRTLGPKWEKRQPRGRHEHLTWAGRRVRLITDARGERVVQAVLTSGDRTLFVDPDLEPHTRWKYKEKINPAWEPHKWEAGQASWRGLGSLLGTHSGQPHYTSNALRSASNSNFLPRDYPLAALCLSVTYGGTNESIIDDVFVDSLPIPLSALDPADDAVRDALIETVTSAEDIRVALNNLDNDIRKAVGNSKRISGQGTRPGDSLMPLLEEPTLQLLNDLQRNPDSYEQHFLNWEKAASSAAWHAAEIMLDNAPPSSFSGRIVKSGKKEEPFRLLNAEAIFKSKMRKALKRLSIHAIGHQHCEEQNQ